MSQEDAVIESLVRNRADLGGDLCLDMGSGIITGIRVGVEGLGSLLGLGRKSATDALVFKNDKLDMAEDMSAMGSLHVSTGLEAARILRFESFSGLKGRGPPIFSGTSRTLMVVVEATGVVGSESGWFQMICLLSQIRKSRDDAAIWRFPPATRTPLSSSYALQGIATTCDDIRKKINAHLRAASITNIGFVRQIAETFPHPTDLAARLLTAFLGKKGPKNGADSPIYYAAYVYFEKLRIKNKKAKSKKREEMEEIWDPYGVERRKQPQSIILFAGEKWHIDEYGQDHISGQDYIR
jgi:hypothetical protein